MTQSNDALDFTSARLSGLQKYGHHYIICAVNTGTITEIDSDLNVPWRYVNPITIGGPVPQGINITVNDIFRALRYPLDFPGFENRDLTPGGSLEISSLPTLCELTNIEFPNEVSFEVFPNPVVDELGILDTQNAIHSIQLFDQWGRRVLKKDNQFSRVETTHLSPGLYFLNITDKLGQTSVHKIQKL